MKVIYIAGPFRGADSWVVNCNIHRAEQVAYKIASMGAMPVCPHSIGAHFDGTQTGQFWLDGTLELMRRCDAVYVLEGWEKSEGTRGEIAEAERLGLPIFYQHVEGDKQRLRMWVSWASSGAAKK